MLTIESVKQVFPKSMHNSVTQELIDQINDMGGDPEFAETFRENLLSYAGVLRDGKFKTEDYLNALAYASFKLMGDTNKEAYIKTFPDRYDELKARNASEKDISSYVSMYAKGKLVNLIIEQSLVPTWLLNADTYQKAINVQASIMNDDQVSAKVRVEAANSILTHLKRPEAVKVELDLGIKESAELTGMKQLLGDLAAKQLEMIGQGISTKEIAHQVLVPAMKDVTPDE